MKECLRIIGIDPGSRATGYGVIDSQGDRLRYVTSGVIRTVSADFNARLRELFSMAGDLVAEYQPNELAIERVFVNRNADSALKLGAARAALICGTFAAATPISEYTPRAVKQAVTGRGAADKRQVQHMVRMLLSIDTALAHDAADALAVAVCHANGRRVRQVVDAVSG